MFCDDVSYIGPLERAADAEQMLAMAAKYAPMHGGMRMIKQFEDGDDVCSIYDLVVETPVEGLSIPTADWIRVSGERVAQQRVLQDVRDVAKTWTGGPVTRVNCRGTMFVGPVQSGSGRRETLFVDRAVLGLPRGSA